MKRLGIGQRPLLVLMFVVGTLSGMALTLAIPIATAQAVPQNRTPPRFRIVFSPHVRADTFLLDTETGRTWLRTAYTHLRGDPTAWEFQTRADNLEELQAWWRTYKPKDEK